MRTIIFIFPLLGFLVACSPSEKSEQDYSQVSFSMDTVRVDSKGEILFTSWSLSLSDFSDNQEYLYNFSMNDHSVEVIDMNSLEFVERIPFEKEGPNGVGEYIGTIQLVEESSFFISSFEAKGIYDFEAKQIKDLNQNASDFEEAFFRNTSQFYTMETEQLLGNYTDWDTEKKIFGKADLKRRTFESTALEKFDFLENYSTWLVSESGGRMAQSGHWTIPSFINDKVIISNNISSDFYVYDLDTDSLNFIEFDHKLFPKTKEGTFPKETSSPDEYRTIRNNYRKGINFGLPIWDNQNKVYYRFSYAYPDSEAEDPPATVYLTILDESFKILNETEVPELTKSPSYHFAKDGKIWIFENMDDEIGFVRISFKP